MPIAMMTLQSWTTVAWVLYWGASCFGWTVPSRNHDVTRRKTVVTTMSREPDEWSRRKMLQDGMVLPLVSLLLSLPTWTCVPLMARAASSSEAAEVTDKIYLEIKGLDGPQATGTRRIVIGLFGKDAPSCTKQILQLVGKGLPATCRPLETRALQREQLEANKVFKACKESEAQGVTLRYSQIWRIVKNARIDVGAVQGKFVSRTYPTFADGDNALQHDKSGVVSVRRGNDGGFGFTIYPGPGNDPAAHVLDNDHIVVGRVLQGMDVVESLNAVPVIASAKVNYMGLTGGAKSKNAPSRSCRYGGPMYCNENKPLIKLTLADVGTL